MVLWTRGTDIGHRPSMHMTKSDAFSKAFGTGAMPEVSIDEGEVTAVVLAYNEADRFPYFLEHHRKIGVSRFIVVDNNSSDGTGEYLDSQDDVVRIFTKESYKENKSIWRQLICDAYLEDRWTLFPDVDELFWYPGLSQFKIDRFTSYLDENGYQGVFTTMVDMYSAGPLSEINYEAGRSFLESCPFFDSSGYRYVPLKGANGRAFNVPSRHLYGGARERLFHHSTRRKPNRLDRLLLETVFSVRSKAPETDLGRYLDRKMFKFVKNSLPGVDPLMSKVPLLKWKKGMSFSGGVHSVSTEIRLAPDWCALLHFKYLDDFKDKVTDALDRKQHAVSSRFYKDYVPHLAKVMNEGAYFNGSARFAGEESLLDCGLMRMSKKLAEAVNRLRE